MKNNNVYKGVRLLAVPFFAGLLFLYSGCSKSADYNSAYKTTGGSGSPGANEVWIQGSAFSPSTITVPANTAVTWTNKDSYAHTVTSDVAMFDSGNMGANSTYSFTFTTKGTYSYHCSIHASMTGTVIVN
jgi:plastocyanin